MNRSGLLRFILHPLAFFSILFLCGLCASVVKLPSLPFFAAFASFAFKKAPRVRIGFWVSCGEIPPHFLRMTPRKEKDSGHPSTLCRWNFTAIGCGGWREIWSKVLQESATGATIDGEKTEALQHDQHPDRSHAGVYCRLASGVVPLCVIALGFLRRDRRR